MQFSLLTCRLDSENVYYRASKNTQIKYRYCKNAKNILNKRNNMVRKAVWRVRGEKSWGPTKHRYVYTKVSRINAEFVLKNKSFPKIPTALHTRSAAETHLTGGEILQVAAKGGYMTCTSFVKSLRIYRRKRSWKYNSYSKVY